MGFSAYKNIAACAAMAVTVLATTLPASALDRRVTIVNQTGYTMTNFYGSHRDARTWEEDILGRNVLPTGRQITINFDDRSGYCIFDFKAVFSDGDEVVVRNRNICELATFTFNP